MELKRVLLNKKIFLSFILIIAVSVGFYINAQFNGVEYEGVSLTQMNADRNEILNDLNGKSISEMQEEVDSRLEYASVISSLLAFDTSKADNYEEYQEYWLDQEQELRSSYPDIAEEFDENKASYDAAEIEASCLVLSEISEQLEYIASYPDYLDSIDAQAQQMNSISIFSESNSLSSLNISKTVEDYSELKGISLELGSDEPLISVLDFELIHYLAFFFSVILVFAFVEERKRGLWNLVYSAPKGRFSLALKRAGILSLSVALVNIVMYAVMFSVSFSFYGGADDLFRNVQSIQLFQNFIYPMNELEFIAFYILINILTQLVLAFLIWFVVAFIQNTSIAIGAAGVIFAGEFLLYSLLPAQSNFALFKCMNVFYFVNPTEAIIKYSNINAFVTVINLFWLVIISAIIFTLIFASLSVAVSSLKHPGKTPGKLEIALVKLFGRVTAVYWKLVEKLNVIGIELYKVLIVQKGIVVLAAFVFVIFSSASTDYIYYSGADSIVKSFYEEYSAPVTDNTLKYVEDLENEIAEVDEEFLQRQEAYYNNEISADEYTDAQLKLDAYDNKREALEKIKERIEFAQTNSEQGTESWLVEPDGYENLLGESGFSRQQNFALISIFCLIIMLSGVFAFEKCSAMYPSLMATCRGRGCLFRQKIICAGALTAVVWLCSTAAELYDVCSQYTLSSFGAPVKNLEFLNSLPFNISIAAFLVILY
ncbi:MAG: YtzC family protein, partial [Clostridiales bacterium]|nr:YtzC family protein [Clostridiales bacterium]